MCQTCAMCCLHLNCVTSAINCVILLMCVSFIVIQCVCVKYCISSPICVDAMDGPWIVPVSMNLGVSSMDIYLDGPRCIHGRP